MLPAIELSYIPGEPPPSPDCWLMLKPVLLKDAQGNVLPSPLVWVCPAPKRD